MTLLIKQTVTGQLGLHDADGHLLPDQISCEIENHRYGATVKVVFGIGEHVQLCNSRASTEEPQSFEHCRRLLREMHELIEDCRAAIDRDLTAN